MRKFSMPLILALSVLSTNVNADALGLFIGGGTWDHDPSGNFASLGSPSIDVESDLKYSGESDTYFYAAFEHFVPLVPNIRIEAASLGHSGTASAVTFLGSTLTGPSSISLDTTDAIIYYRILDNWISLDLGLNLRKLEADFIVDTAKISVSESIPMVYGSVQFDLPFTGFSVGGDMNLTDYSGSTYREVRLRALYEMGVIGFEAGIKSVTLELDDVDNINADLEFEGIMLGAFLHF